MLDWTENDCLSESEWSARAFRGEGTLRLDVPQGSSVPVKALYSVERDNDCTNCIQICRWVSQPQARESSSHRTLDKYNNHKGAVECMKSLHWVMLLFTERQPPWDHVLLLYFAQELQRHQCWERLSEGVICRCYSHVVLTGSHILITYREDCIYQSEYVITFSPVLKCFFPSSLLEKKSFDSMRPA